MGKSQKAWAMRRRARLIEELGGECVDCGTKKRLEVDHKFGTTWTQKKLGSDQRVSKFVKEAARGLIEIRCRSCNARKGRPSTRSIHAILIPFQGART